MVAIAAFCVSVIALVFSGVALAITYRKEAHRIRLELSTAKSGDVVLGVINDGGIDTSVRSIGYFRNFDDVIWIVDKIGDYDKNQAVEFPFLVKARTTFAVYLNVSRRIPGFNENVGLCVQLDTGRIYVLPRKIGFGDAVKMYFASWTSRVTGGLYAPGVDRPRIKS